MRTYKARNRDNLIEQRNQNSLTHLLKSKDLTTEAKHDLVNERNPYLHIFGETLTPMKSGETYADWINRQYIGEAEPQHITTKEEAMQYLADLIQEENNAD